MLTYLVQMGPIWICFYCGNCTSRYLFEFITDIDFAFVIMVVETYAILSGILTNFDCCCKSRFILRGDSSFYFTW